MNQKTIKGSTRLANEIKNRRKDMGLTIEEAASRAGVGTKTWCRYEAGEAIRKDKVKGVCKALNWRTLPEGDEFEYFDFNVDKYRSHKAWSKYLEEYFGEVAAVAFVIGSDILLDYINEDLKELSYMPPNTHIGQVNLSMTKDILPEQFLTKYDYDFLFCMRSILIQLRKTAGSGNEIVAHSVMQELVLYLVAEEAELFVECVYDNIGKIDLQSSWVFDIFDDMDIVTWLYSDMYITIDNDYHFDHWLDYQFYIG